MESRLFACINFGSWKCQNDSRTPKRVASDQLYKIQCNIIKTYKPRTLRGRRGDARQTTRSGRPQFPRTRTRKKQNVPISFCCERSLAVFFFFYFCTPARGRLPTGTHTVELPCVLATDVLTSY